MITVEQIELLRSAEMREAVKSNLGLDPVKIALSGRVAHAALVASQVKYLQRARRKLPSYYAAQCIIPSLAFEQSSSEECAAHKNYSGKLCIDLTCGLGVDSLHLSRRFERVISLERDPALAGLARCNFGFLEADNIEVVCASAEDFLAENSHLRPDLIYADPDRRGADGRKLVCMEDCSPDMTSFMPLLRRMSPHVVVKCSPMFDVDAALGVFGEREHTLVEVVSLGGECKEVVVEIGQTIKGPLLRATAIGVGSVEYMAERERTACNVGLRSYRYLIVPDVALQKARVAVDYYVGCGCAIDSDNGFALCDNLPAEPLGRVFEIERMEHYSPKKLRRELREAGVRRIDVLRRGFVQSAAVVARELGVAEGGGRTMAFMNIEAEPTAIFLR